MIGMRGAPAAEEGYTLPEMREHIAIFLPQLSGGGTERIMLNVAGGFAEKGHRVDLVVVRAAGPLLTEVPESVRLVALGHPGRRTTRALTCAPALVRYLRRERPAVLLSVLTYANIIALWAWRLARVPQRVVISERNTVSQNSQALPAWYRTLLPRLMRAFYPWADDIIAVSQGVADDVVHITGLPRERVRVIYNPVVTPRLRTKALEPLEHPWFAAGQPPVVLAAGRLTAAKGFGTLIQAIATVRETCPVRLLILGEGADRPKLEALVRQLGLEEDVALPGFVANPYAYMARASLFVLSSRWEGLPNVVVEAMYCGAPVVATDCPSGPREILQEGRYGKLVPVGDAGALAQAIETTLATGICRPPEESWRPFDLETVMNQYADSLFEAQTCVA